MNPKLFKIMIGSLVVILILGIGALIYILNSTEDDGELTSEQMVEYSFTTEEMNTDLRDGGFVQIQFNIITDSKKARDEIQNRSSQLKNKFIKESVKLTEADFQEGLTDLENNLKDQMNKEMDEGKIIDVYIISKIIQ